MNKKQIDADDGVATPVSATDCWTPLLGQHQFFYI